MASVFQRAAIFPLRHYGSFIEKCLDGLLKNRFVICRGLGRPPVFSKVSLLPLMKAEDCYHAVDALLDDYFEAYKGVGYRYKGVNIPTVFRRELHLLLTEMLNHHHQIAAYQRQLGKPLKCDARMRQLLAELGVKARCSFMLSALYGVLDALYGLLKRFQSINPGRRMKQTVCLNAAGEEAAVLLVSVNTRNDTFKNLSQYLADKVGVIYVESIEEGEEAPYQALPMGLDCGKGVLGKLLDDLLQKNIKQSLIQVMAYIDDLERLDHEHPIAKAVIGLTGDWRYNVIAQWIKQRGEAIYFQDVFITEDFIHNVYADKFIINARFFGERLKRFGINDSQLIYTQAPVNILSKSIYDLSVGFDEKLDRQTIDTDILALTNQDVSKKRLVVIASDPGNYFNTSSQKLRAEQQILRECAALEDVFCIIKLHPQDDGLVGQQALKLANNSQALVTRDLDIYPLLSAADVVISKYSTTVLEALIMKKPVLLMNYDEGHYFEKLALLGAVTYLNQPGDLTRLMDAKLCGHTETFNQYVEKNYSHDDGGWEKTFGVNDVS